MILSTRGGALSGGCLLTEGCAPGGGVSARGGAWWRPPSPGGRLLLRAVRILLECILVLISCRILSLINYFQNIQLISLTSYLHKFVQMNTKSTL